MHPSGICLTCAHPFKPSLLGMKLSVLSSHSVGAKLGTELGYEVARASTHVLQQLRATILLEHLECASSAAQAQSTSCFVGHHTVNLLLPMLSPTQEAQQVSQQLSATSGILHRSSLNLGLETAHEHLRPLLWPSIRNHVFAESP